MQLNTQIPIYYHIPKCGGTYILNLYEYLSRQYRNHNILYDKQNFTSTKLRVSLNNNKFVDIVTIVKKQDLLEFGFKSNYTSNNFEDVYYEVLSIKELYNFVNKYNVKITSIFIQPTGDGNMLESRNEVDKFVSCIEQKPRYFVIIRDVFDRLYSQYCYLKSEISSHENTRQSVANYNDFEDFLINAENYTNMITGHIAYNLVLDDNSFDKVKEFFSNFTIGTMESIHKTAMDIWNDCHDLPKRLSRNNFYRNANKDKKNISINDISDKAKKQFLLKTKWDRKLYAYLSQK